ncbi:hypothetical protein PMAYCL1PPCAC_09562, partial [Pristionchus mayeri]
KIFMGFAFFSLAFAQNLFSDNKIELGDAKMAEARSKVLKEASDHLSIATNFSAMGLAFATADTITEQMRKDYNESIQGLSEIDLTLGSRAFEEAIVKTAEKLWINARDLDAHVRRFIINAMKGGPVENYDALMIEGRINVLSYTSRFLKHAFEYVEFMRTLPPFNESTEAQRRQFKDLRYQRRHIEISLIHAAEKFAVNKVAAELGIDKGLLKEHLVQFFWQYKH